ncbi:MAG: ComEC/Rec2 family competence protein, partial [Planctomycetota bacterium]
MATGEVKQSASALWLSAIVLLIIDPFMAWQYGFGLS